MAKRKPCSTLGDDCPGLLYLLQVPQQPWERVCVGRVQSPSAECSVMSEINEQTCTAVCSRLEFLSLLPARRKPRAACPGLAQEHSGNLRTGRRRCLPVVS